MSLPRASRKLKTSLRSFKKWAKAKPTGHFDRYMRSRALGLTSRASRKALRFNPSGDDFKTEHVSGNVYLMKRYDDWYPMRKTPQGGLAFLNGPGDRHDGSKASALRIAKEHLGRANPSAGVPGIAGWNMYSGGTGAAPGKHSYDLYISPGNLSGGRRQYRIDPISGASGRHLYYKLSVAGSPEFPWLWHDFGGFKTPQRAAAFARKHFERTNRLNPGGPPAGWMPVTAVKIERKGGMVKVRIRK